MNIRASNQLKSGFTTGACATAAAKGAALMLVRQASVHNVTIELPTGNSSDFKLFGQSFTSGSASCYVVKDAGDDPDVTNGAQVHARVTLTPALSQREGEQRITITGGTGIGRVTKPGLAVPPGEWAINPVPRQMIETAVQKVISPKTSVHVTISIPDGEERSKKTLNARLGIIGGLSILGTTGIVRPISAKAWTDTIKSALDVAKACGRDYVVLSTGRTSEMAAQRLIAPPLSEESFIMMGDHIASAVRACQQRGFGKPVIACQFAKLLKIACGHENTHAAASVLDLAQLLTWAEEGELPESLRATISSANTAREIAITSNFDPLLLELVSRHARMAVVKHAPDVSPRFLVADYSGNAIFTSS